MKSLVTSLLSILALGLWPCTAHAAQSYDNCAFFIDSVPTVITTQGVWCLRKDLSTAVTTGAAITIAANNVTLDCNDFKLGGLAAGVGTQANGVLAQDRLNATVRHCNIRGFRQGVSFEGASGGGHVVEDNRFDGNTWNGLYVAGDGSVVRRNLISDTGGSTSSPAAATGVVTNYVVDVLDNTISGVQPNEGFAFGIYTEGNLNGSISGNRVRGLVGDAYGIVNSLSGQVRVRNNDISGDYGSGTGLSCEDSTGSAKDNIISGFATPILGCTALP